MSTPVRNLFSGWTPRTDPGRDVVRQDADASVLLDKLSKLENELFDYQYNMGLLLIEKKEWSTKLEEIKDALDKANDLYRREQNAHAISLSEVEKREEHLRQALGVEKQCVLELEKALREMRSEYAQTKYTADSKLAEANALATSVEEKSLEVESKLRAADAKIAEVSRKNSEVERKLRDIEAQETALRIDRSSFNAEREAHESDLSKLREELREWERKLNEGEERLADSRTLLNQREQRANENDRLLRQKQNDLEEEQKKIDLANSVLRKKEDDLSSRLAGIAHTEKELEDVKKSLVIREKELDELQEKLNAREREEIQKLMDEHKAILQSKEEEFELEMRQRRTSLDDELKSKVVELEKKEAEVNHSEEKLKKREQALEKRNEKIKEKEKDLELKLKALKEKEKCVESNEKELETDKAHIFAEKESLLALKAELENEKAELEKLQLKINEEMEQLKITENEKMEIARLQSELKQETDNCRLLRETLLKETEDLKLEKERFEKEWEELDEKRSEIKEELQEVNKLKKNFEKMRKTEEEKLIKERLETESYVQKELKSLKLAQETFAATMEHERSVLAERTQSEKIQMVHDFERQKQELESKMQRKQEEMEATLHEQEKLFEEEKQREVRNVNNLREVAHKKMEDIKSERARLEREKQEISANKLHLEVQQLEMKKDISELVSLSRKLKDQRAGFAKERERFVAFVKKQESCSSCGEEIRLFELSDLQAFNNLENIEAPPLQSVTREYLKNGLHDTPLRANNELSSGALNSGSAGPAKTDSWLRKCAKLLKFSPGKKIENPASQGLVAGPLPIDKSIGELPDTLSEKDDKPDLAASINDALNDQGLITDDTAREVDAGQDVGEGSQLIRYDTDREVDADQDVREDSQHSNMKNGQRRPVRKGRGKNSKTGLGKAKAARAKTNPGENLETENTHSNGVLETSINEESQKESSLLGGVPSNTRKRPRIHTSHGTASEIDGSYSDGQSDSVTASSRRKRRQKAVPSVQLPRERRYNLRHPRSAAAAMANGSLSEPVSESQEENRDSKPIAETPVAVSGGDNGELRNSHTPSNDAADNQDGSAAIANELVDDTGLSEEVNETPDGPSTYSLYNDEHEGDPTVQEVGEPNEEDSDEDDDEMHHPGEVSIGKKIWTFITT